MMAVNTNPLFTPGQSISDDELRKWLAMAGLGTMDTLEATEGRDAGQYARTEWTAPGEFGPTFARMPWGEQALANDGGMVSDGTMRDLIYQPRNRSTFGNSDTTDIWDANTGDYLMATQQGTALRDLANFAAMAAGAYYGANALKGGSMDLGTLAKLAGAAYGAYEGRDKTQTTTQTHDPWAPAQPYLLAQLGNVAKLQQHYQNNPVNDLQKGAANQKIGLLSALNSQVLPGLLSGMGTLSAGYQRPGGPAPRPSGMNYDPSALLAGMQGNNIDWSRMFPKG